MKNVSAPASVPAFDVVGRYNQDEINGFQDALVERMLETVDPPDGGAVLDAMAGDGNLSVRLLRHLEAKGRTLRTLVVLEASPVQAEFARAQLRDAGAEVIRGDALSLRCLETGRALPEGAFDRVMIKSANHEIPQARQAELYAGLFRALRPGGRLVNLGFLFDDPEERDEMREIARVKDTLAGMDAAATNRHFLTRDELYGHLKAAGFADVQAAASFEYRIRSSVVAKHYFRRREPDRADREHQAAQAKAMKMRRLGRIRFDAEQSLMICPGEITVATRPGPAEARPDPFRDYPYEFLRNLAVHRELLDEAERDVREGSSVLDLGCGPGLFAERLARRDVRYLGVDISEAFVDRCRERLADARRLRFRRADIGRVRLQKAAYDAAFALNVLYIAGIEPIAALLRVRDALRPGGILVVSGPTSARSFQRVEPQILAQLERDGLLRGNEAAVAAIRGANARLLTEHGNYWSAEGMATLLMTLRFAGIERVVTSLYHGHAFLVAARR